MHGARGFAANDADEARMRIAQRIDGDAAEKIEIGAPSGIVEATSLSVGEHYRRAIVRANQMALFVTENPGRIEPLPRRRVRFCLSDRHNFLADAPSNAQ